MAKRKSHAQIQVADGAGGMRTVTDLRFEVGIWPIELVIPAENAESWMAHLHAEADERGWTVSSFSQLDAAENSGTISIHMSSGQSTSLEIVWERQRNASLQLRARPGGEPILSLDLARDFINAISIRQRAGKTLREHCKALLIYNGLPWRGELWLDGDHRLSPPSKHPDTLLGPQAVLVDALVEGIGKQGVIANFQRRLHELPVFLGITLGLSVRVGKTEQAWVCDVDGQGRITDCTLRNVGYVETSWANGFPTPGNARQIERRAVVRPGLGLMGITSDVNEQWVPADIEELWRAFARLSGPKREHFMRAGNAYLIAKSMWPDQRTAYAAFLVVACEALKPAGKRHDRANFYDVVASLISPAEATSLQRLSVAPQRVRSKHLHRGELSGGELLPVMFYEHFEDPSFDEMLRRLTAVSRICLIEWLRCGGTYPLVLQPRRKKRSGKKRHFHRKSKRGA